MRCFLSHTTTDRRDLAFIMVAVWSLSMARRHVTIPDLAPAATLVSVHRCEIASAFASGNPDPCWLGTIAEPESTDSNQRSAPAAGGASGRDGTEYSGGPPAL